MKKILIFPIILLTFTIHAKKYGDFNNVEYIENYDGDTIRFNIPGIHPMLGENIAVRIRGIDTPELKGACSNEVNNALVAKMFVGKVLSSLPAKFITLKNVERGKYFRIVADVYAAGMSIGAVLIKEGYARIYDGVSDPEYWCKEKAGKEKAEDLKELIE